MRAHGASVAAVPFALASHAWNINQHSFYAILMNTDASNKIHRNKYIGLRTEWPKCTMAESVHYWIISNTHPFNGPLSRTTRVSPYQKGKTNLDFTEARDSEWHQMGHMQVCISLQTDNHARTHHSVFYRPDALLAAQPTMSKHWRQSIK